MNAIFQLPGTCLTTEVSKTKHCRSEPETQPEIQLIQLEISLVRESCPLFPSRSDVKGFARAVAGSSSRQQRNPNSGEFRKFNPGAFFPNLTRHDIETSATLFAVGTNAMLARANRRAEFRKFNQAQLGQQLFSLC